MSFALKPLPAQRRRKPRCKACGDRIVFVRMHTGNDMPAQPETEMGDGRKSLIVRGRGGGRLIKRASREVCGRQPHFGNCNPSSKRPN